MERQIKAIQRGLILTVMFYIVIAVLAISMMNPKGSVFKAGGIPEVDEAKESESEESDLGRKRVDPAPIEGLVTGEAGMNAEAEVPSEPPSEPEEPVSVEPPPVVDEPKYYSLITINHDTILNMRIAPDIDAKSIARLDPGTKGYVLELDEEWSKVEADGLIGYCSNEYLSLTEIQKEDIPEAYFNAEPGEHVELAEE